MRTADAKPGTASKQLLEFQWLVGAWVLVEGAKRTVETWLPAEGPLMIGASVATHASGAAAFEFLRLESRGSSVVYVAMPNGQGTTEFAMVDHESGTTPSATFRNPAHDFPTWIRYRRDGDVLIAEVGDEDPTRTVTFRYRRIEPTPS